MATQDKACREVVLDIRARAVKFIANGQKILLITSVAQISLIDLDLNVIKTKFLRYESQVTMSTKMNYYYSQTSVSVAHTTGDVSHIYILGRDETNRRLDSGNYF